MKNIMGNESQKFVLDARKASRLSAAASAGIGVPRSALA